MLSVTTQFSDNSIVPLVTTQLLSWTHYEKLLQVEDKETREWYAKEAYEQTWSVRTLQRNISSQHYHRLLKSQDKSGVESEMKKYITGVKVNPFAEDWYVKIIADLCKEYGI